MRACQCQQDLLLCLTMLKKMLDLIPEEAPTPILERIKPMQVGQYQYWWKTILYYLVKTDKDFTVVHAPEKADGNSVLFVCQGGDKFAIYPRTEANASPNEKGERKALLEGEGAARFITQLACTMRAQIACELRALYDGKEMGFLEVLAMLKVFKENGMQNTGKFELQLCPFGLHSVHPETLDMPKRGCTFLPSKVVDQLLREFIPRDSPITRSVQSTPYKVCLTENSKGEKGLEFRTYDGKQTVAGTPEEFFDYLIGLADRMQIEGFVLEADPAIWEGQKRVNISPFGVRKQWAVKVKREFKVTLLACKVLQINKGGGKQTHIYTYGLDQDNTIVYAGKQTEHTRLQDLLSKAEHAFSFSNKDEQEALYSLSRTNVRPILDRFVMVSASCAGMSKDRFCCIGLKIHDMRKKTTDLSELSVLKRVAEENPHFCSTRDASNAFAKAIKRDEKKLAAQTRKRAHPGHAIEPVVFKRPAPARLLLVDEPMDVDEPVDVPPPPVNKEEIENDAWVKFVRRLNETPEFKQEVYCMGEDKEKVPVNGAGIFTCISVEVEGEDGKKMVKNLGPNDPEWTVPLQIHDSELFVGPPFPPPYTPPEPFRRLTPPVNVYIDSRGSPDFHNLASLRVRFFGGLVTNQLSEDVHAIVVHNSDVEGARCRLLPRCGRGSPVFLKLSEIQAFLRPASDN